MVELSGRTLFCGNGRRIDGRHRGTIKIAKILEYLKHKLLSVEFMSGSKRDTLELRTS